MGKNFIDLITPNVTYKKNKKLIKQRFGPLEDGGYVLSEYVLKNCKAIFAYGIGHDSRFEEEFSPKYNIPSYMFDHTIRELEKNGNFHFHQYDHWEREEERWEGFNCHFFEEGLGFGEFLGDFNDHYEKLKIKGNVLLKIDIEGGEYDYFPKADLKKLSERVLGIVIELHMLSNEKKREEIAKILSDLEKYFVVDHVHGNNWGGLWRMKNDYIPETIELSLINKKVIDNYEVDNLKYPIKGLDYPNNPNRKDYDLKFLKEKRGMKISIGDMVDRYTICKLKTERTELDNSKEMNDLWNEIEEYEGIEEYIGKLYDLHSQVWDLEGAIRSRNEEELGLEEVGRRAIKLRDLNSIRVGLKNELNSKFNEGYLEIKLNHGSEIESSVVVSLTTVPERLEEAQEDAIKSCIISLCEQNDDDYQVHFNIPVVYNITNQPYHIPDWLHEFKLKYPHLRIYRTEDWGPPTKMIPTINRLKNKDTILVVVDDDLVYHPDMVTEHRKYQKEYEDSVIVYEGRGCKVPLHKDLRDAWVLCVQETRETDYFQHYKSASYRPRYFKENFFTDYVGKTFSDDVLLSVYFRKNGYPMLVVPYEPDKHLFVTFEDWNARMGVTTFPVLKHTRSVAANSGCNHPGLLALPNGGRFYEPPNFGDGKGF